MPEHEQVESMGLVPQDKVVPVTPIDTEIRYWNRPALRIGVGGVVLGGVAAWLGSQFFQLRGYVNIAASRIDLVLVALCVIAWIWILARNIPKPKTLLPSIGTVVVLALAVGVDQLTLSRTKSASVSPQPSTPDLKLDLEHGITIIATDPGNGAALFVVSGALLNFRGPETATMNWQMWLDHLPNREILHGRMIPNLPNGTDVQVKYPSLSGSFVIEPSKFWPELTSQPMKAGSVSMGWVWCEFPITLSDLDKQEKAAILHVQFDDVVSGKTHESTLPMNTASQFTNPPWFPKVPREKANKAAQ